MSVDGSCSFDIKRTGAVTNRAPITTPGSRGELFDTNATMTWSATNAQGFSFVSDPSPTTGVLAQVGRVATEIFADGS